MTDVTLKSKQYEIKVESIITYPVGHKYFYLVDPETDEAFHLKEGTTVKVSKDDLVPYKFPQTEYRLFSYRDQRAPEHFSPPG